MSNQKRISKLTPDQLELLRKKLAQKQSTSIKKDRIQKRTTKENYSLSSAQRRLWFLQQMEPDSAFYNIPSALRLNGPLNPDLLEKSLNRIIERHEILRAFFTTDQHGEPVQKIAPECTIRFIRYDLRKTDHRNMEAEAKKILSDEATHSFDLKTVPLLRAALIQTADEEHILLVNLHHIIADGWSLGIIIRELILIYRFLSEKKEPQLPPPSLQFTDYSQWQLERATQDIVEKEMNFWREYLKGMPPTLELFTDFPRPPIQMHNGKQHIFTIEKETMQRIMRLSRELKITPYAFMMTTVQVFLQKISGQDDFGIGAPIANRNRSEVEEIIGFFVNTIVLRARIDKNQSFESLAAKVQNDIITASDNQDAPFDRIVDELVQKPDLSRSPLFQVMFDLQKIPFERQKIGNLEMAIMDIEINVSKFDLLFLMAEYPDHIRVTIEYNTDLFNEVTIQNYASYLSTLIRQIVKEPKIRLGNLSLALPSEQALLAAKWNKTQREYPRNASVVELFEKQVRLTPQNPALEMGETTLTYEELNENANQLAHFLLSKGVSRHDLVALYMERSAEMITGFLAILKIGAAYVPMDVSYPKERLNIILEDTQARLVLTQQAIKKNIPANAAEIIALDSGTQDIEGFSRKNPQINHQPTDRAYVIYTSGSTGRPKGVVVPHRAIIRLVKNTDYIDIQPQHRICQISNAAFDAATFEIWGALLNGAKLVGISKDIMLSTKDFARTLRDKKISHMFITTALFNQIAAEVPDAFKTVHTVMFGGEKADPPSARKVLLAGPPERLLNVYGPTENTTFSTWFRITHIAEQALTIPIGRPIANSTCYVLDDNLNMVPAGVPGELYVGGDGLALEYLDKPELTAERFISNSFPNTFDRVIYKTGDLVRMDGSGVIEFLGRIDQQVKIRGFRIELGEIETVLRKMPGIKDAVVMVREKAHGDKVLAAYFVADEKTTVSIPDIRTHLLSKLPDYMVPALFRELESIPLTPNGKVDKKALPEPEHTRPESGQLFIAPRNELEAFLAAIWKDILGLDTIGVYDNFFDLGGNSLKAAALINRLQEELKHELHVGMVFQSPRIAEMAMYAQEYFSDALAHKFGAAIDTETSFSFGVTHIDESKPVTPEKADHLRSLIVPLPPRSKPPQRNKKNPPAVFLLSPPRSGSTLLRIMLAGNKQLFSPPELDLLSFNTLGERYRFLSSSGLDLWLEATIRALMELRNLDNEAAEKLMRSFETQDMSIKDFYYEMQRDLEGRLLVDKTPSYPLDMAIMRRAEEDFDQPFYIHLVRHPYAMIYSFIEAKLDKNFFKYDHPFTRQELAELIWIVSHQNILTFLKDIPQERQIRLRFEDVLLHPEMEIRKLCDRLGIEFQWDMLEPYQGKKMTDGVKDTSQMVGDFKFYLHKDIDSNVAEKWRKYHKHDFLSDLSWTIASDFGYTVEKNIISQSDRPDAKTLEVIKPAPRNKALPLSYAQQRLWFLDQMDPGSSQYNIPGALRIKGRPQLSLLTKALNEIVKRHESLRTIFLASEHGEASQVILPSLQLSIKTEDIRGISPDKTENQYQLIANREAARPFELDKAPLLRASLIRGGDDDYLLVLVTHHIISDGWSVNLFIRELAALYNSFVSGQPSPLPTLPIQYADYAVWQRNWLSREALKQEIDFWKNNLEGMPSVLELPFDSPRTSPIDPAGKRKLFHISLEFLEQLRTLSRKKKSTLFNLLLTAFEVLLYKYSGQSDFGVGTPVANRTRKELEPLIGFFVNTLVLRASLEPKYTFSEFLEQTRQNTLQVFDHQDVPFEYLVDALQPERDTSHSPLFQVMFSMSESSVQEIRLSDVVLKPFPLETGTAKFDLMLEIVEHKNRLVGIFEYRTSLFRDETIERFIGHFMHLLRAIVENPDQTINQYPLLDAEEMQKIVHDFNAQPALEYEKDLTLPAVFERQAQQTPDNPAVSDQHRTLTFNQLNEQANRLAHYLMQQGVHSETIVGIYGERIVDSIVSIMAVLKAGGAYLPIDPSYPPERIEYMLRDSGATILLSTSQNSLPEIHKDGLTVLAADELKEKLERMPVTNPALNISPESLAYIIYTSGSTGKPKGVMIQHRSPLNLAANLHKTIYEKYGDAQRRISLNAPLAFDASVQQIVMMLHGHHLILIPQEVRYEGQALISFIRQQRIELLDCVPSQLKLLMESGLFENPGALTDILPGGEAIDGEMWRKLLSAKAINFYNMYGPTECTVDSTICPVRDFPKQPTIGRPAGNFRFYVLNEQLQPQPVGVAGELHIAGDGVGRGYLNRPELTAEKFIPNPFSEQPGERLYKTGDLVCFNADGSLSFKGRTDFQVKLRGFRIELGEIENALRQHPAITDALVLVREDTPGHQQLTAYVIQEPGNRPKTGELRSFLNQSMPEYMIPVFFIPLEAFPLTPNGKINRGALPQPEIDLEQAQTDYVAPTSQKENIMVHIWQDILRIQQVGIRDNFFELGGDSILTIQVIARAKREGLHITPRQLFEHPTIEALAAVAEEGVAIHAEQGVVSGTFPATPIQRHFFEQNYVQEAHWNQSVMLKVAQPLDSAVLKQVVTKILEHHDILRLRVRHTESGRELYIAEQEETVPFDYFDFSGLDEAEQYNAIAEKAEALQAGLNLQQGPIIRIAYFNTGEQNSDRLLLTIHHLAVDGVSWRILTEDIQLAYAQAATGQKIQLPAKSTSFKYWAEQLAAFARREALRNEFSYWKKQLHRSVPPLPVDFPNGINTESTVQSLSEALPAEDTQQLLQEASAAYNTQINELLLAAFSVAYKRWSGSDTLQIAMEGHGREDIIEGVDISRTVGWFTSLYPVVLTLTGLFEPAQAIKHIKEELRRIPGKGLGFGLLRYLSGDPLIEKELSRMDAGISFNYLGQFDRPVNDGGAFEAVNDLTGSERGAENKREFILDISGSVKNGQLHLQIAYSGALHKEETIRDLLTLFREELKKIIAHCLTVKGGTYTPSDFTDVELEDDEISDLLDELE